MCGIFGIANYGITTYYKAKSLRKATRRLLEESEVRGSAASGICVLTKDRVSLYKSKLPGSKLVNTDKYSLILKEVHHSKDFKALIGHTRAPTQGSPMYNVNNHPITTDRIIGVHNGQISNDYALFSQFENKITRKGQVDSEIIFQLIDYYRSTGSSLIESVEKTNERIIGSCACAFIDKENPRYLSLFSNKLYGDLVVLVFATISTMVFASTEGILKKALKDNSGLDPRFATNSFELKRAGARIDLLTGDICSYDLKSSTCVPAHQRINRYYGCGIAGVSGHCDGDCENCEYGCNY
jgi:predicted glutamine amidotransferase